MKNCTLISLEIIQSNFPLYLLHYQYFPVHIAAKNGRLDILKILLFHGANVNVVNSQRKTCLHFAADCKNNEIIDFLINETDIYTSIRDKSFNNALDLYLLDIPGTAELDMDFCHNFIDKTFQKSARTGRYPIKELLNSESSLFEGNIFLGKYVIEKFYSTDNSKYYLIEKLEELFSHYDSNDRYSLYLYVHDEFLQPSSENKIQLLKMIHFEKIASFIYISLLSDQVSDLILEFLEYLNSVGVIKQLSDKSMQHLGFLLYNLQDKCYFRDYHRIEAILKFFHENNFDMNAVLQVFLQCKHSSFQHPSDAAWRAVSLILPYTTKFFLNGYIMRPFFFHLPNAITYETPFTGFIKRFFQNFGDYPTSKKMKLANTFSLQHICRNKIRGILLENMSDNLEFLRKIDLLPLPVEVIKYLKFDYNHKPLEKIKGF
jgi:hypothetical protein